MKHVETVQLFRQPESQAEIRLSMVKGRLGDEWWFEVLDPNTKGKYVCTPTRVHNLSKVRMALFDMGYVCVFRG